MMKRHPDGRWRSTRQAIAVSEAVLRARWVEAETIRLKKMGFSFDEISEQITRVGGGQALPLVAIPERFAFPPDYTISRQACHKAFRKAIAKQPALEVEELRKLDNARSEEARPKYFSRSGPGGKPLSKPVMASANLRPRGGDTLVVDTLQRWNCSHNIIDL